MNNPFDTGDSNPVFSTVNQQTTENVTQNAGLRSYMLRVYNFMSFALFFTGITAYAIGTNEALMAQIFGTPLKWLFMFLPLGLVLFFRTVISRANPAVGFGFLMLIAISMGVSMSTIFAIYPDALIFNAFLTTSVTFTVTSMYGYATKRDLSSWGTYLMMGVIGLFVAGLLNVFFFKSGMMALIVSCIGVIIFTALIAYDTQKIKDQYYMAGAGTSVNQLALMGALMLYLDFINLFIYLVQIMGSLAGNRD